VSKTAIAILAALVFLSLGAQREDFVAPYPYNGRTFRTFVEDSYIEGHKGDPQQFYNWFAAEFAASAPAYKGVNEKDLPGFLNAEKARIDRIKDPRARAAEELRLGEYLHKVIKKLIPLFSLEHGFEFHAVQRLGQRQCLLQAVLIAGLLQQMHVNAGVVMVYRSVRGEYSFNGHVTTLVKLSDGSDVMVDASEQEPLAKHQGILARTTRFCCLTPVFAKNSSRIAGYQTTFGRRVKTAEVSPLDANYVRSQFYYYRGERAPDGILSAKPTKAGLAASAYFLEKSVKLSPANSLAVYMLGRTYAAQGKSDIAKARYQQALKLQRSYGWVPFGIYEALRGT